ncbi:hypothetical protein LUZ60_009801 [Juncus effusus]|nr:hypothetical protein LUZ60_009801 [Juncus effusus]
MGSCEQMQLQRFLRMNSGVGERSYAKNSTMQKVIASLTKPTRQVLASEFYRAHLPDKMIIADLGCSVGPNAFHMALDAIQSVIAACQDLGHQSPEFQIFLNDLPWNDFNSLFRSMGDYYMNQGRDKDGQHCFITAAPGSFYGRLFPAKSLNYIVSSSCLHWLSQVPPMLQDGNDINKGKIYISKTSDPSVNDGYKKQFQEDFSLFLKCRGVEIVNGGVMVLTFMARRSKSDPSDHETCYMWELLAIALMDLVSEGLIDEEMVDSYNAPYYPPSMEEVTQEITKEGSFVIKKIEIFEASYDALMQDQHFDEKSNGLIEIFEASYDALMQDQHFDEKSNGLNSNDNNYFTHLKARRYAELTTKTNRAVLESMIRSHFGGEIIDELFNKYCDLLEEYYCKNKAELTNMLVALERI